MIRVRINYFEMERFSSSQKIIWKNYWRLDISRAAAAPAEYE